MLSGYHLVRHSGQIKMSLFQVLRFGEEKNGRWSRQSEETTLTRALDLATMVIKIVDSLGNNKKIEPIRTLRGSLKIEEVANAKYLKNSLNEYLKQQDNINDIKAHIDLLYDALRVYKK